MATERGKVAAMPFCINFANWASLLDKKSPQEVAVAILYQSWLKIKSEMTTERGKAYFALAWIRIE